MQDESGTGAETIGRVERTIPAAPGQAIAERMLRVHLALAQDIATAQRRTVRRRTRPAAVRRR